MAENIQQFGFKSFRENTLTKLIREREEERGKRFPLATIAKKEPEIRPEIKKVFQEAGSRIKETFTEPVPGFDFTPIDFVKELPSSTKRVLKSIAQFSESIRQGIARNVASLGITLLSPLTGIEELTSEELGKLDPNALIFKEVIFGPEPLKSLQTRLAESQVKLETEGLGLPFTERKLISAEKFKEKPGGIPASLALSGIGIFGSIALDLTGTGGSVKSTSKVLSTIKKADDVADLLKGINVADDLINVYKGVIAKLTKADDIVKVLDNIIDIQKTTTRVRQEIGEQVVKTGVKEVGEKVIKKIPDDELIKTFERNIDEFVRSGGPVGPDDVQKLNAPLRDLMAVSDDATIIKHTTEKVKKAIKRGEIPVDDDGLITLHRVGGDISDERLVSASFSDEFIIKRFPPEVLEGRKIKTFKVKPDDIKVFIGAEEGEVLVSSKFLKGVEGREAIEQITKPRKFLESVSNAQPDIQLKVGGQYIPRSTDDLAIKAKNLIADNIDEAERIARTRTDDVAVATASELIKHYGDEAIKATDQATKNVFWDKASDIAHLTAKNLTEQGQAIQAASIMGRQTPEGMLRFAAKEINRYNDELGLLGKPKHLKKLPQLTAKQSRDILKEMDNITKMPDGTKKAMAFKKLNDTITDLVPTSLYKKIITVWKAGLLTGIKTSGLNTFSNLSHGQTEVIKDIPAIIVDSIISLFTKERTIAFNKLGIKQTAGGMKEGVKKGWRYLTTGFDERNIGAKLDFTKVNFGDSKFAKAIQKYEESIFHLLGAEDQPFFYGAKARSLGNQAAAQAKNAGLKGKEATKFIDDLVKSPTDEMLRYAVNDAEIAVFQNETTLGKIAKAVQKAPLGEIVVPFGRTPSAVANQLINYSPIGIVKTIVSNIGKGKFDQRLFAQGIGRAITGTAVMYLGTKLWDKGLITLGFPKTEKERELWKIEGRKANSIKILGKWRDVNVLGPAGLVLIVGANYQKSLEETGSLFRAFSTAIAGGGQALTQQTFLQGINRVMKALDDPGRFGESFFSSTASSLIPTIIGDIARAIDTGERRQPGLIGRIKGKIPGIRQTLEPQIDVLGQQRQRAGNWLETLIDPTRPVKILNNPVAEELRRLTIAGFAVSPSLVGDRKGFKALTPEENTAMWEKVGELMNSKLTNLFDLEQYKNLSDEEKAELVDTVVSKSKALGRAMVVMELTADLRGDELKKKLSELKEGGLMTRPVFNKYLELQF